MANYPIENPDYSGYANIFQNYFNGMKLADQPRQMEEQRKREELQRALLQTQAQWAPKQMQQQYDIGEAKLNQYRNPQPQMPKNNPILQFQYEIERRKLNNPNDPSIPQLETALTNALQPKTPAMSMPPLQKLQEYRNTLDPNSPEYLQATNQITKMTSDPVARQKSILASNIDKTLEQINAEDLVRYAGSPISKGINYALSPFSAETENFDKYKESLTAADMLASQVRQFYGDSIQPEMRKHLENLTSPGNWANNPELAMKQFEAFKKVLLSETASYKSAVKSPDIYKDKNGGTVTLYKNGIPHDIPAKDAEDAIKNYGYTKNG